MMPNRINKYLWKCREISQSHDPKPQAFGRAFRFQLKGRIYTDLLYITAVGEAWPWIYCEHDARAIQQHIGRLAANSKVVFSHYDALAVFKLMLDAQACEPCTTQHDASFPPRA